MRTAPNRRAPWVLLTVLLQVSLLVCLLFVSQHIDRSQTSLIAMSLTYIVVFGLMAITSGILIPGYFVQRR